MVDRQAQVMAVIGLIESGKSENAACEEVGIHRNTFRSAAMKMKVADEYARAMASLAQHQVEQVEQAITDMREGRIDAQMARVEIDARKWFASKFLPRTYGDKVDVNHGGKLGHEISVIERRIVRPAQPEGE